MITTADYAARLSVIMQSLRRAPGLASTTIVRSHPLTLLVTRGELTVALIPACVWDGARELLLPLQARLADGTARLLMLGRPRSFDAESTAHLRLSSIVSPDAELPEFTVAIASAFDAMEAHSRADNRSRWADRYRYELGELVEIAAALSTEREVDKLLALIVEKSRFITGADAGSLYVVEGDEAEVSHKSLRFKVTQNDSVSFDWSEFSMPISSRSMSGYVALHRSALNIADVYDLPADAPYAFDASFDERIGYLTRSMLSVPLLSRVGEVIGVIQLINKKKSPSTRLSLSNVDDVVTHFDERSVKLVETLASQAGIALENAILYDEIQRMLRGFVHASVEAIEQRDPTTSGHSRRVANLTVALARCVERVDTGVYRDVAWRPDDLLELEYASLLHDFGKIGVREEVLVKAKKLYAHELEAIRLRFQFAIRTLEVELLHRKLKLIERCASADEVLRLDEELAMRRSELERGFEVVLTANEPTVLSGGDFQAIERLARETYVDFHGKVTPLLSPNEVASLCIARGSLTAGEIEEIRKHVTHTFEFLSEVPWGKQFRRVAAIAGAHHERLNGTGYPHRLRAEEIPLQSKMMSVSDIFDALTASDRPYKKAIALDRALDILRIEVREQHIDEALVGIFIDAKVWELAAT